MRIAVLLDRARLFRWHTAVLDAMAEAGHTPVVRFRDTAEPLPISVTAILDFDHARSHAGPERFSQHIKAKAFDAFIDDTAEPSAITIDLSSSVTVQRVAGPVLRPLYDGSPKDYALFHCLLERRAPHLSLWYSEAAQAFDIGQPALDEPSQLAISFDQTTSRLIEGLLRFLSTGNGDLLLPHGSAPPVHLSPGTTASILKSAGGFVSSRTLRKARRLGDTFSGNSPRWHVAWRAIADERDIHPGTLNLADYHILGDDAARTYAAPCIVVRDGAAHVFVAELPEATSVGVISHFVFDGDRPGVPTHVMTSEQSLSHPFVFERDGELWMLPEQANGGGLDLYRCTRFPDQWQLERRLIDGALHDATLFDHDGRLWITAGCEAFQSSTADGMALYWADRLLGPWHAHTHNPVVVDARAARPAGPLWRRDGQLYRPAQDCTGGIGSALTLTSVTELTPVTFAEQTLGTLAFGRRLHLNGPHTICRAGGIEVIDVFARPSALRAAFRAGYRSPIAL